MSDFLNNPNKACDLEFCRPIIFFSRDEKPGKKENWLDRAAARLTALRQTFIGGSMKNHRSKSKFLGGVKVNPQGLVGVVMYESQGLAQGLLNALEQGMFLGNRGS